MLRLYYVSRSYVQNVGVGIMKQGNRYIRFSLYLVFIVFKFFIIAMYVMCLLSSLQIDNEFDGVMQSL